MDDLISHGPLVLAALAAAWLLAAPAAALLLGRVVTLAEHRTSPVRSRS